MLAARWVGEWGGCGCDEGTGFDLFLVLILLRLLLLLLFLRDAVLVIVRWIRWIMRQRLWGAMVGVPHDTCRCCVASRAVLLVVRVCELYASGPARIAALLPPIHVCDLHAELHSKMVPCGRHLGMGFW